MVTLALLMNTAVAGPVPMFGRGRTVAPGAPRYVVVVVPWQEQGETRLRRTEADLPDGPTPVRISTEPSAWQQKPTTIESPGGPVRVEAIDANAPVQTLQNAFRPIAEAQNHLPEPP